MFETVTFYIAFFVFIGGLFYKIASWFRLKIGYQSERISASRRITSTLRGIFLALFSRKILTLIRVFVLDVLVQRRILKEDFFRWIMHITIFGGFTGLLLMHALGDVLTSAVFPDYYATLNPFMFLRDLFGAIVILGIVMAIYRRFIRRTPRLMTNVMDHYAIVIVAVIMISGIVLEGTKIVSYSTYQQMVDDYAGLEDEQEMRSLEAYWVSHFGVVSPRLKEPFDAATLEQGAELHDMSCVECHSRPQWAFTGFGVAKIIQPVALWVDSVDVASILHYIHILGCFIALAYLPFSKMFHIIASPVSLLVNAVREVGKADPATTATRQAMELDACTHCGACTLRCSVGIAFEEIGNRNILPSEKIASIKALASGKRLSEEELKILQEGVWLCTNCYRCTVVCPAGINLQDLWFSVREQLLQNRYPEYLTLSPICFYRGLMRQEIEAGEYEMPMAQAREAIASTCDLMGKQEAVVTLTPLDRDLHTGLSLSAQANTFTGCFGCETCTTVCPVVKNYENPKEALGLLPHQIMHACALGIRDLAFGSNMLWDCITCYQCQEQCPQGVAVTDVLYELKNVAVAQMTAKKRS
jgi:heterodisulfide reductase subunit C/nitrate reductase gamma subunit